jgi:hypothetical protein
VLLTVGCGTGAGDDGATLETADSTTSTTAAEASSTGDGDTSAGDGDGTSGDGTSGDGTSGDGTSGDGDGTAGDGDGATGDGDGTASCPTGELTEGLTYDGNTVGAPNLAESLRLEWESAGDHALLFEAPAPGSYLIELLSEPSTNAGCGVSAHEYMAPAGEFWSVSSCPATGTVADLDGIYDALLGVPATVDLSAGERIVLWFSCAYWSSPTEGAYSVRVSAVP